MLKTQIDLFFSNNKCAICFRYLIKINICYILLDIVSQPMAPYTLNK